MKNSVVTILFILMLSISAYSDNGKEMDTLGGKINSVIRSEITYPEFALELGLEGVVYVQYKVQTSGIIKVINIAGNDPRLCNYVREEISKIKVDAEGIDPETIQAVKIVFRTL